MRVPRVRFTLFQMLLGIVVIAANFAAIARALKTGPRLTHSIGMAGANNAFYDDGSIVVSDASPPGSPASFRPYLARPATIASRLRRWGPVAVVATVTVAIVIFSIHSAVRRRRVPMVGVEVDTRSLGAESSRLDLDPAYPDPGR